MPRLHYRLCGGLKFEFCYSFGVIPSRRFHHRDEKSPETHSRLESKWGHHPCSRELTCRRYAF